MTLEVAPMPTPEPNMANLSRGAFGERLAATTYRRAGCEILDRNWRSPTGELDLVVRDRQIYVFCEVKTRRTNRYGSPAEAVGPSKQRRIRRLAIEWLRAHQVRGVQIRFDVVSIVGNRVQIIESAF